MTESRTASCNLTTKWINKFKPSILCIILMSWLKSNLKRNLMFALLPLTLANNRWRQLQPTQIGNHVCNLISKSCPWSTCVNKQTQSDLVCTCNEIWSSTLIPLATIRLVDSKIKSNCGSNRSKYTLQRKTY
jgi:hypothetical protein